MIESEALGLVALVMKRWPSLKLTPEQIRQYGEDVVDLDAGTARAALDAIHRDGREWAPTSGDVRRRVALLELAPPEWVDVKRQLIQRHEAMQTFEPEPWTCPHGICDGDGWTLDDSAPGAPVATRCECYEQRKDAQRMAESLHPLVREFIRDSYVTWGEVEAVGAGSGTRDGALLESQMRVKWERFAARAVESRAIASIDAHPELPRLEAARQEDAPRKRGQIKRRELRGFGTAAAAVLEAGPGEAIVGLDEARERREAPVER